MQAADGKQEINSEWPNLQEIKMIERLVLYQEINQMQASMQAGGSILL